MILDFFYYLNHSWCNSFSVFIILITLSINLAYGLIHYLVRKISQIYAEKKEIKKYNEQNKVEYNEEDYYTKKEKRKKEKIY